jgi:hypothetical protein
MFSWLGSIAYAKSYMRIYWAAEHIHWHSTGEQALYVSDRMRGQVCSGLRQCARNPNGEENSDMHSVTEGYRFY